MPRIAGHPFAGIGSEGFDYIAAKSGEEAFVYLETGKPDIIWLDLLMPGMGGFAFLEKLREMPAYRTKT